MCWIHGWIASWKFTGRQIADKWQPICVDRLFFALFYLFRNFSTSCVKSFDIVFHTWFQIRCREKKNTTHINGLGRSKSWSKYIEKVSDNWLNRGLTIEMLHENTLSIYEWSMDFIPALCPFSHLYLRIN